MQEESNVPLKVYYGKQLAAMYGVNVRTFFRWLEPHEAEIGLRHGRLFDELQVQIVFRTFGWPKERRRR